MDISLFLILTIHNEAFIKDLQKKHNTENTMKFFMSKNSSYTAETGHQVLYFFMRPSHGNFLFTWNHSTSVWRPLVLTLGRAHCLRYSHCLSGSLPFKTAVLQCQLRWTFPASQSFSSIKSIHEGKKFPWPQCGSTFTLKENLQTYIK